MTSRQTVDDEKERLSSFIKNFHTELRRKYLKTQVVDTSGTTSPCAEPAAKRNRKNSYKEEKNLITHDTKRDPCAENLWAAHTEQTTSLKHYAAAMQTLATEHWQKYHEETRIDWCRNYISKYFDKGELQKYLDKDDRILDFHKREASSDMRCCGFSYEAQDELDKHKLDKIKILEMLQNKNAICLPLSRNITVLDVGSCYAPFSSFDELQCVSIDLCPANENVHQCDFLNVELSSPDTAVGLVEFSVESPSKVVKLTSEAYHVVVFSLLLEYLPSPVQRWRCCVKAEQLLCTNGLLIVITPDSNKMHRRAKQIADWKTAMESIGLRRCVYEKLDHLHCMAFRKVGVTDEQVADMSHMMYIPQDFNTRIEETS